MKNKEFKDWIEMRLYLAGRDSAVTEFVVLKEVYQKLYDKEPDLKQIELSILKKKGSL